MSPEKIAGQLVKDMGFSEPPIDVEGICKRLGIELSFFDAKVGKILGVSSSLPTPDGPKTVFSVNGRIPHGRRRFTIAHEIGHFILGHLDGRKKTAFQERQANRFASELLMPDDILGFEWCWYEVDFLARRYGVSLQAMNIRISAYNIDLYL